jgi:molybdopterin converting factor subunit 1
VQVRVFYFAAVRDLVGQSEEVITIAEEKLSAAQLIDVLLQKHTRLLMDGVRVAVNEEFVELSHVLADGDTLALIPPVSGG